MKFGFFTHLPWPEETDAKEVIDQSAEQVIQAEGLGFYSAWLAEHHFTRYSIGSSSLILATNLAARTQNIRLGTAVIVSPLHNPLWLAEDTATLDLISDGRLDVGFGRGAGGYEYHGFNIDADAVADAITPNTRAIIPVHLFGQTADMDVLWRTAVAHNIPIIEDACQAIGAEYQGRKAGVLGRMGCFSFFPTKNLGGAGDGGVVTVDDGDLAARIAQLRVHGDAGGYQHLAVGFNSRLDALQAAILRVKLTQLETWTEQRIESARHYDQLLDAAGLDDWVVRPRTADSYRHVYNQYTIRVPASHRDLILGSLREDGVGCAVYYPTPLHLQPCFESLGYSSGSLPCAERAATEVISLPIAPGLNATARQRVIQRLEAACQARGAGAGARRRAA